MRKNTPADELGLGHGFKCGPSKISSNQNGNPCIGTQEEIKRSSVVNEDYTSLWKMPHISWLEFVFQDSLLKHHHQLWLIPLHWYGPFLRHITNPYGKAHPLRFERNRAWKSCWDSVGRVCARAARKLYPSCQWPSGPNCWWLNPHPWIPGGSARQEVPSLIWTLGESTLRGTRDYPHKTSHGE